MLIGTKETLAALAESVPEPVERLVEAFWPGGLTIVLPAQPSLVWDLGETLGTVAVRMPEGRVALELLAETGPLAVSSANLTGEAAAISAYDAEKMLGDSVAVYLADGLSKDGNRVHHRGCHLPGAPRRGFPNPGRCASSVTAP